MNLSLGKVTVTRDHIKDGKRFRSRECPIYLAVTDRIGDDTACEVTTGSLVVWDPRNTSPVNTWIKWPEEISQWIRRFDLHHDVEPLSFELWDNEVSNVRIGEDAAIEVRELVGCGA